MTTANDDEPTIPPREAIVDLVIAHTCMRRCFGTEGNASGCCRLGNRDFIIGPIPDTDALLERLRHHWQREVSFDEVFIGFDEGRALQPGKPSWQRRESYPALRISTDDPEQPCRFLSTDHMCTIHAIRSATCSSFFCNHLKDLLARL